MFLQHVCICVKDLERSVKFYRDVMGFYLLTPDPIKMGDRRTGDEPEAIYSYYQEDCGNQCFRLPNAEAHMAVFLVDPLNPTGGVLEIQCFTQPPTTYVEQNYVTTGIKEICYSVKDLEELEAWEARLKEAGVDMRTEIWQIGEGKLATQTLLFHDPDGIILQLATNMDA